MHVDCTSSAGQLIKSKALEKKLYFLQDVEQYFKKFLEYNLKIFILLQKNEIHETVFHNLQLSKDKLLSKKRQER